jgi:WD40 repeat protein
MTCVKCLPVKETSFITGSVNGEIFLWKNTDLITTMKAFDMPVLSMCILQDKLYATGAVESRFKVFSTTNLQELPGISQRFDDEIKSITVSDNLDIVVSLAKGSIVLRQAQGDKVLILTHECGELWNFDVDKATGLVSKFLY